MLFHKNPGLIDTVDGIARRIGRRGGAIAGDVSKLESDSFLLKKKVGRSEVYYLNRERDAQAQSEIADYIRSVGEMSI